MHQQIGRAPWLKPGVRRHPRFWKTHRQMRRRIALILLTLGAVLMIGGGVGDLLLREPPAAWDAVVAPVGSLPPGAARLLLTLLHTLGGALAACGLAVLALVYGPLRRGERWAGPAVAVVALLSDGLNAWGMGSLGLSYFWGPLAFTLLVLLGLLLAFLPGPVFSASAPVAVGAGSPGQMPSSSPR